MSLTERKCCNPFFSQGERGVEHLKLMIQAKRVREIPFHLQNPDRLEDYLHAREEVEIWLERLRFLEKTYSQPLKKIKTMKYRMTAKALVHQLHKKISELEQYLQGNFIYLTCQFHTYDRSDKNRDKQQNDDMDDSSIIVV